MLTYTDGTEWKAQKNYKRYPKDSWTGHDKIANWIIQQGYRPITTIENIVENIELETDELENINLFNIYTAEFHEEELVRYINNNCGLQGLDYIRIR